jgi:RimJ/RimL family protein N-acetyltransferase
MIIKTDSILLKPTSSKDAELNEMFQDFDTLSNMSEKNVRPIDTPSEIIFRIEFKGQLIGEIRLKNIKWYNRKSEISLMIAKEHRGKGFAQKALKSILEYAFNTMNFYRLEAEVIDFNEPSKKLVEKSGFTFEGRLREAKYVDGKYYDILRYGLLKREWKNNK